MIKEIWEEMKERGRRRRETKKGRERVRMRNRRSDRQTNRCTVAHISNLSIWETKAR